MSLGPIMSKNDMPGLDDNVFLMWRSECTFLTYLAKKSKIGLKALSLSLSASSADR